MEENKAAVEARRHCESCVGGGGVTVASLPTRQHQQLNKREADKGLARCILEEGLSQRAPQSACHAEKQRRTPVRGALRVPDAPKPRAGPGQGSPLST